MPTESVRFSGELWFARINYKRILKFLEIFLTMNKKILTSIWNRYST